MYISFFSVFLSICIAFNPKRCHLIWSMQNVSTNEVPEKFKHPHAKCKEGQTATSATERLRLLNFSSNENSAYRSQFPKLKATN